MTDSTTAVARPVPRWLLAVAVLAAAVALVLLVLGQLVTTLKAGMADPAWPTEPWYLINNYKDEVNYLVEHAHRIVGFALGGILGALTLCVWWLEPRKTAKWVGVAAVVGTLLVSAGVQGVVRSLAEELGDDTFAGYAGLLNPFTIADARLNDDSRFKAKVEMP